MQICRHFVYRTAENFKLAHLLLVYSPQPVSLLYNTDMKVGMEPKYENLKENAIAVLQRNNRGTHTVPSETMYPHAWLWDSAFISIGLSHLDPKRAATELDTIFDGQWRNGMIPNMRFSRGRLDRFLWNSRGLNSDSPRHVYTSGITQPPILAEAVQRVGQKLERDDRQAFTIQSLGRLVAYHQWIYSERNPNDDGLFAAVHPWETGMENTPTWMEHMRTLDWGSGGKVLSALNKALQYTRRDTQHTTLDQRSNSDESLQFLQASVKLRRTRYDHARLADYPLHFQDVQLNSILIRNNEVLEELAADVGQPLPDDLKDHMAQTRTSLEDLWDEDDQLYYPRDAVTGKSIKVPTVASLMPTYPGSISPDRMEALVTHLKDPESFDLPFGVPTVPQNSPFYREHSYWSGPTWVNTNWLLTEGLRRSGRGDVTQRLGKTTLDMVTRGGMYEYFSSKTAEGLGAKDFSWTAALILDLLAKQKPSE